VTTVARFFLAYPFDLKIIEIGFSKKIFFNLRSFSAPICGNIFFLPSDSKRFNAQI